METAELIGRVAVEPSQAVRVGTNENIIPSHCFGYLLKVAIIRDTKDKWSMTPDVPDKTSNFIFYSDTEGNVRIEVIVKDETVWLTQRAMADLFGVKVPAISKHLSNIYESGELDKNSTISFLETVQKEGKRDIARSIEYYSLDVIIAVGYRVNSYQATRFRIWATKVLKEYLIKGFVLDDERLKQGSTLLDKDYFEELLERIREIRSSERRFYLKITDIYSTAVDHDRNAPLTRNFFAKVQNKLHWAISGKTAADINLPGA